MNKWITRIIVVVLLLGAFAGVGMTAYRMGYGQGVQATGNGAPQLFNRPNELGRGMQFNHEKMPQFHPNMNNQGFNHGFAPDRFSGMGHGRGFGFFPAFQFLFGIAVLGLVIWLGYKLFKGNGWQFSLTRQPVTNEPELKTTERKSTKSNK